MKLALGTAQLGLTYGVANKRGRVSRHEAEKLIRLAADAGIRTLDTAIAYGDSEQVLGEIGVVGFSVVTKLPAFPTGAGAVEEWVERQVSLSLQRLGIARLHGLLLHRPDQLLAENGVALRRALLAVKTSGAVEKIGVSVYDPAELGALMDSFELDIVQAPFSIFDRRLLNSGWLDRLSARGVDVHVRSVFMQGLLLMPRLERPNYFGRWNALWLAWESWLSDTGLTPLEACLRYVDSFAAIAKIVVGLDTSHQLTELLEALDGALPAVPPSLQATDLELLNPTQWKLA